MLRASAADHGDIGPVWYSFDLARKRVEEGGWTHQVTQRGLPPSIQLAGVNMRLTSGSIRELHWHTADEWAYMEYGNARESVMNPDGTMFIDGIGRGDLWFFPAGYPHSIQGLGPDGCQFLLVFNEGMFSEDNTFLLSEFAAHIPREALTKNTHLSSTDIAKLPTEQLYIFPAALPRSLAEDRAVDFKANDVGFVPAVAGHYIENTGDTDVVFLEMFRASRFVDFSLNNWIGRMPPEMAAAHLRLDAMAFEKIPTEKNPSSPGRWERCTVCADVERQPCLRAR